MPDLVPILKVVGGVSTGIGAVCVVAALFAWSVARTRQARSISEILIGEGHGRYAQQAVKIIKQFRDEERRLQALTAMLSGQTDQARVVLEKINRFDAAAVISNESRVAERFALRVGLVLLGLGIAAVVASRLA